MYTMYTPRFLTPFPQAFMFFKILFPLFQRTFFLSFHTFRGGRLVKTQLRKHHSFTHRGEEACLMCEPRA